LQRGGPLFAGGVAAGLAHRDLLVERLDAFDGGVSVGAFAQPDLEEADLALLLRDTLRVFQHHDAARLLHPLAGLVDADDAVRDAVDAQRIVDALLERVGAAAPDGDLPGAGDGLALDDAIVLHRHAVRRIAVDQKVGRLVERDPGKDARIDIADVGNRRHARAKRLIQAAEDNVVSVLLGDEQVIVQPQRVAVVVGHAVCHCAQRHHRGHAHGDAEHGQKAAGEAAPQVV
jgi:hypothetical protein